MKRNHGLDILKVVCSFLVVCIHASFPTSLGTAIVSLSRVAVPLFFVVTGYYYAHTKERRSEKKQIKKIFCLIVTSNLLYVAWNLFLGWMDNDPIASVFSHMYHEKSLLNFAIFNISPVSEHLWYLNAILYVLLIVFLFEKKWNRQKLYPVIPFLILANLILGTYSPFILGSPCLNKVTRNFLFVGLPYFLIGDMIYTRKITIKTNTALLLLTVSALVTVFEGFLVASLVSDGPREHYFGTAFSAVGLFMFALQCKVKTDKLGYRVLCYIGAKLSANIYILHVILIDVLYNAIEFFSPFVHAIYGLYYIQPIVVYVLTLSVAWGYQCIVSAFKARFCGIKCKSAEILLISHSTAVSQTR